MENIPEMRDGYVANVDLSGMKLDNFCAYWSKFVNVNFSKSSLKNAGFIEAEFVNVDFSGCDLREAAFHAANLKDCTIEGADLRGATVDGNVDLYRDLGAIINHTTRSTLR